MPSMSEWKREQACRLYCVWDKQNLGKIEEPTDFFFDIKMMLIHHFPY